jgi:hypothetical protein
MVRGLLPEAILAHFEAGGSASSRVGEGSRLPHLAFFTLKGWLRASSPKALTAGEPYRSFRWPTWS